MWDIANMAKFQVIYNESPGFLTNLISQGLNCSLVQTVFCFFSIRAQVAFVLGIVPLSFDSCTSRKSGDVVNRSSKYKLGHLSSLNFIAAFGSIFRTNLLNNMFCVSTTFTKVLLRFLLLVLSSCFLTSLYSDPLESSSSAGRLKSSFVDPLVAIQVAIQKSARKENEKTRKRKDKE